MRISFEPDEVTDDRSFLLAEVEPEDQHGANFSGESEVRHQILSALGSCTVLALLASYITNTISQPPMAAA